MIKILYKKLEMWFFDELRKGLVINGVDGGRGWRLGDGIGYRSMINVLVIST